MIKNASDGLLLLAVSIGAILFWQIPYFNAAYNNIAFVVAYALSLLIIISPVWIAETGAGVLSKEPIVGSFHFLSGTNRFFMLAILSMLSLFFLLMILLNRLSIESIDQLYSSYWYFSHSAKDIENLLADFPGLLIITTVLIFSMLYFIQKSRHYLHLIRVVAGIGLLLFCLLFFFTIITTKGSYQAIVLFLSPNFNLITSFALWHDAIMLALLSGFIGLGINLFNGHQFPSTGALGRLNVYFVFGSIIAVTLLSFIFTIYETLGDVGKNGLGANGPFIVNVLYFCSFFCCGLVASSFIYHIFTVSLWPGKNRSAKWLNLGFLSIMVTCSIVYTLGIADKADEVSLAFLFFYLILAISYIEILLLGWVFGARKMVYQLSKHGIIKLSAYFTILLRIIVPTAILSTLIYEVAFVYFVIDLGAHMIILSISFLITVIVGSILHRRHQ